MDNADKLVIEFEPTVLADIFAAIHLCEVEISGLARVERNGRKFKVYSEAIIFDQTCSFTGTEPDTKALGLYFNDMAASGDEDKIKDIESQTLWWHSHVWFEVVFSGTDLRTMKRLLSGFDPWWLVLVVNKRNQACLALIEKNDGFLSYEEAPISLNPELSGKEFEELVISRRDAIQDLINRKVIITEDNK